MLNHSLSPAAPGARPVRVLVIEDNPQVLHDLRRLLELSGEMEIAGEAESEQEAARLVELIAPDVVVMDLEVPGLDGYAATRRIKSSEATPRVVLLSVHGRHDLMERARKAGADGFVVKGASYQELVDAILGHGSTLNSNEQGE